MVSGNEAEEEEKYVRAKAASLYKLYSSGNHRMCHDIFVNEFLSAQGITAQVGLNPWTVLTSGLLGTPGVALLYGISFYGIM